MNVLYMGTPEFAVAPLRAILEAGHHVCGVITVPDKPAGRGRKIQTSAVKEFALTNNLPLFQPEKLRDEKFISEIKSLDADVFVVVAFRMLPDVVWKIPPKGTFNLHASLLPQYRGAAPINWVIINREKESGVTTFLIDDKIDTGHILLQRRVSIANEETAGSLHDKLMEVGADLVVKTIEDLSNDAIQPVKQQKIVELKHAPKIFKEDCKINWNKPGEDIEAHIRGLSPYPAAFTAVSSKELNGALKITSATFRASEQHVTNPILKIEGKKLIVLLPDGMLELHQIQSQGKRSMSATDFINGIRDKNQDFYLS